MIKRLERLASGVEGLPATVKFGTPDGFFEEVEREGRGLVEWRGELYFELHRGTYTSHASIKRNNRCSETLLRETELLSILASNVSDKPFGYPKSELDRLWKLVLLNQFHDVLPGSSIGMVYEDAEEAYRVVREVGGRLRERALGVLVGEGGK
ncbi:hypothetical protein HDU67_003379, partial [Dinochytrium kinnereticum]